MPRRRLNSYLRTNRLKAALTQAELGELLGLTADAISKYELGQRTIPANVLIASQIVFGVDAADLFPALVDAVEDELGRRTLVLHDRLANRKDAPSRRKLALLAGIPSRLHRAQEP